MEITRTALAKMVDHTLLKTDATHAQISALVAEARDPGAFSICVSPSMLPITFCRASDSWSVTISIPDCSATLRSSSSGASCERPGSPLTRIRSPR